MYLVKQQFHCKIRGGNDGWEWKTWRVGGGLRHCTILVCCLICDTPDESLSPDMSPDVDCHSDRFQKLLKKSSTFSFDTSLFCCPQITHSHTHARKCEHTLTVHINTQTEMHARTCKLRTHYALHVNVLCPCGFHSSLQTEIPALLLTQLFLDACVRSLAQLLTRLQYRRSPNTLGSVFTLLLINSHQSGCMPLHKQCNILINTFPLLFSFI